MEPPLKKILKVFDQDGLYKTMAIEPSSTAGEICEKFAKKLFLDDSEIVQFSLFIFEGGVRHQLKVTDFPFDYLIKYEKKDFKFYFLNPNGEFISFDKEKQKNNSSNSGPPKKELPMPNISQTSSSSSTTTTTTAKSSKGMSSWLLRKRPGRYDKVWAVSKGDKYLKLYENEDTDSEPLYDLSLENSIVELKQDLHLVLTLGNSERYTFTSENESEIVAWANELQATMNYQPGQSSGKPSIKNNVPMGGMLMGGMGGMGGFVPTSRDLGVKLQSKAENSTTQLSTLVNWVNHILSGKGLKCSEEEILTCFSDGVLFVNLIDDLFNQKINYRKGKSVYEMQYNVDRCLEVLKEKCKCDYGKIMSSDVTDCKVAKIIVRILWSMFVSFVTNGEKEYAVKDKILVWASNLVVEYTNKSIIVDSPSALRNPLIFGAVIAKLHPGSIDYQSIASKKSREDQAQLIINIAFEQFSIPKLVSASFWSDDKVDEKSFLIYLSMFYYYLSNQDQEKANIIKSAINQRDQCEPESSIREKQIKSIKEKQDLLDSSNSTSSSSSSTIQEQDSIPSKPISQPTLKKASGKPLPLPRKLPPTAKPPPSSPSPVSSVSEEQNSSTATTQSNTITINGVTINKPKPPASTLKKPAPVPLKPKPNARPPSAFVKSKEDEQEKLREEKLRIEEEERLRLEEERARLEAEEEERARLEAEAAETEAAEAERLRLEEERLEQEKLDEEERELRELEQKLEKAKQEKERKEKLRQQQLENEKQERIRQEKEREEKEERDRKLKESQISPDISANDILESDAFKLLDEIVVGCDKYTSTSSPSNSQLSFPNSYENSNGALANDDIEQFTKNFEQLQNEEDHYNSFLKPNPSRVSTKDINITFDTSVVSELDSIIDNLPGTSNDTKAAISPDSSSSAKEASPDEVNDSAAPKSPTVTSTKVRKALPTLTKEQEQVRQSVAIKPQESDQNINNNNNNENINNINNNNNNNNNSSNSNSNNSATPTSPNKEDQMLSPRNTQGRVVVRICLEGFGDVLFCSFAIGYDTLCGKVRDMVIKKMKVAATEEHEYSLHIVRDGLERVLDDDEILLEAEDKIDRFVFKKNEFDRKLLISNHRPPK